MSAPNPIAGNQTPLLPVVFKPVYVTQNPRCLVRIDGRGYRCESFRYTQNAHGATDEATFVVPIDGAANFQGINAYGGSSLYPDWTISIQRDDDIGNANAPVFVELWSGNPTDPSTFGPGNLSGLSLRFRGVVDQYSVQTSENKTTFTCRSLAFPLTTTKITVPFPREDTMTTVAFIQAQAAKYGLQVKTNLGAAPMLMIDVLGGEFISGVHGYYIWDLFLKCAQADDVDVWVDRSGVIHYEAASLVQRQLLQYIWGENCKGVDATHSPQFSKNVQVQVHSWTKRTRTSSTTRVRTKKGGGISTSSYTRQVTSSPVFGTTSSLTTSISSNGTVTTSYGETSGGGASGSSGVLSESGREKYIFFLKNKTLAQCEAMAQQIWRQISMHEYAIKLTAPVTTASLAVMDVTVKLILFGHPMARFNDEYWPREIVESLDPKTGWNFEIDAVNNELPQGAV